MESEKFSKRIIWTLSCYFILYVFLTIINLCYIPVAWVDETYFIDPAIQFLKTGRLASKVWHVAGTENFIFGYLPGIFILQIINLSIFPVEMFFIRLPFVLLFFAGMYYLFKLMREVLLIELIPCLIILFFFINDKGTSEGLRSIRIEPIELFFIPFLLWRLLTNKNYLLNTFFLSLFFLTHPKSWMIVALMGLYQLHKSYGLKEIIFMGIIFLLPIIGYLYMGDFDFANLHAQLFSHAEEHDTVSGGSNMWRNHFWDRFFPFYNAQPYVPVIFYSSLIISFFNIYHKRDVSKCLIEVCFLALNIYWFFTLGGFPRYTPVLIIFSYLISGQFIYNLSGRIKEYKKYLFTGGFLLLPLVVFPFLSRHAAALMQREERALSPMLEWYDLKLSSIPHPTLIIGESSAHYFTFKKVYLEYSTYYSLKKFNYNNFREVYVASLSPINIPGFKLVDTYLPPHVSLTKENGSAPLTYYGTRLYKLENQSAFEQLKKLYEN